MRTGVRGRDSVSTHSPAGRGVGLLLLVDERRGIEAAVGVHSLEIATAVDASGWAERKPCLYAPLSESSLPQRSLIAVGDTKQDQLTAAIPHLDRLHGAGASWALVGSDFSWPREVLAERPNVVIPSLVG